MYSSEVDACKYCTMTVPVSNRVDQHLANHATQSQRPADVQLSISDELDYVGCTQVPLCRYDHERACGGISPLPQKRYHKPNTNRNQLLHTIPTRHLELKTGGTRMMGHMGTKKRPQSPETWRLPTRRARKFCLGSRIRPEAGLISSTCDLLFLPYAYSSVHGSLYHGSPSKSNLEPLAMSRRPTTENVVDNIDYSPAAAQAHAQLKQLIEKISASTECPIGEVEHTI